MLLNYLPVKVSPHRYLNSTKFVIQCRELNNMEEDEIAKELRPQGITAVKRISVHHDLYCLTISGQTFPERISVGYLKVKTKPYIPNPQRCFQCHQFGDMKTFGKGKAVCTGCGEQGHSFEDCTNESKCINCEGNHDATSRDCPKWELEKEIIKLKYKDGISFVDARKRLQPSLDPSKNSYASVAKTPEKSTKPQQPWAKNIRPPTDFDTEVQFLKYILNYCLTRLDTGDGGGRPSSVMSLEVTSVGGHPHGHPTSPIGVGSSWEDIDPRSPEPLVVRGGWLWLIWVVRWTT